MPCPRHAEILRVHSREKLETPTEVDSDTHVRQGKVTVPTFLPVPQVKLPNRLDFARNAALAHMALWHLHEAVEAVPVHRRHKFRTPPVFSEAEKQHQKAKVVLDRESYRQSSTTPSASGSALGELFIMVCGVSEISRYNRVMLTAAAHQARRFLLRHIAPKLVRKTPLGQLGSRPVVALPPNAECPSKARVTGVQEKGRLVPPSLRRQTWKARIHIR
jgi:hypothetical protein